MFVNNPQLMCIYDGKTLAFLEVNQAAVNHYGYSKEEFLSMTLCDIQPAEDLSALQEDLELTGNANNSSREWRHIKKNGDLIFVEISAHSITRNGRDARHILIQDITARKRVEAEIKLKNEELQKINAEKDKFFSIIAHDLRSPFNAFLGLTQIMTKELPSLTMVEIQEFAEIMKRSATNLFRLLENLLEWARVKQGLIPFEQKLVDLLPIVDESIEVAHESAKTKGIKIDYIVPDKLKVFADTNILQTIIRNLVSNAVKFTSKGGKISVSAKAIDNESVEISVKDTGMGMSREMIDNLFRLDVQTNRKGTENEPSSGLGLMLCKEFVEKQGGRIWVESEEGRGSTFYFTIPNSAKSEVKALSFA
jgi:PAS domain S-box-containing protein